MQVVVVVLALVGAVAVGTFLVRWFGSTQRVLRAANLFQATSVEALQAIEETPPNEPRQLAALASWEAARAVIRGLAADEQRIVATTLRDRGFPTAEVGEAISRFMATSEAHTGALDAELAEMVAPHAASAAS